MTNQTETVTKHIEKMTKQTEMMTKQTRTTFRSAPQHESSALFAVHASGSLRLRPHSLSRLRRNATHHALLQITKGHIRGQ